MENIDAIIDLLNSENREDFELGVNIIEALEERPVINLMALNEDFEYEIIKGRIRRRRILIRYREEAGKWLWNNYPHNSWEED